ncbi:MAG: tetratricopeptide repeat protein [Candidatus Contendobacter sp.]|jgi:tetratricopeptide (TPR) repeat protein|nr:tetratricopeptide repeat protein [Candidatus Contendobacter sp.]
MKRLFKPIKPSLGLLALALVLVLTGCTTAPYSQRPSGRTAATKAPVVDRSARRPPGYSTRRPAPPLDVGQLPEEDPLLPREYASPYPSAADPYAAPERYGASPQPYPTEANNAYRPPAYPPAAGGDYRQPTYPPGAATPYPPTSQPYPAAPNGYGQPAPGSLPEPQPVVPKMPRAAPAPAPTPAPVAPAAPGNSTVALAPPPTVAPEPEPEPEPIQPPAPPPAPPSTPPADLPPAEITREGNQAVAALLESADKYVKSKQLDKAGAALERALRIEPRNAGIWHDLAQIRLHQGQYQQAESLASKSNNLAGGNRGLQSRNWKVIASARKVAGNVAGAEEAEARASQFSH